MPLVGGKNASLGEMYRELTTQGVRVPNGFAITAEAFRDALTEAGAWDELHGLLDGLDKRDVKPLAAGRRALPRDRLCRRPDRGGPKEVVAALSAAAGAVRRGALGRRAQLGDRRGPADRELRRPARHVP